MKPHLGSQCSACQSAILWVPLSEPITLPVIQVSECRFREVKELAQGHKAGGSRVAKTRTQSLLLAPKPMLSMAE